MITLRDVETIENGADTQEEMYLALQRAINSGSAWSLQGSYGRSMTGAIESGYCMLGTSSARDYYGTYIPPRGEIQSGTKGSAKFVEQSQGKAWRKMIEAA